MSIGSISTQYCQFFWGALSLFFNKLGLAEPITLYFHRTFHPMAQWSNGKTSEFQSEESGFESQGGDSFFLLNWRTIF